MFGTENSKTINHNSGELQNVEKHLHISNCSSVVQESVISPHSFVGTYPLLTGQVTNGHLQLPLLARTSRCCGCCGFLLLRNTHGRAKGPSCCPVGFGSLCLTSQTAFPELQPEETRHCQARACSGSAFSEPSQVWIAAQALPFVPLRLSPLFNISC